MSAPKWMNPITYHVGYPSTLVHPPPHPHGLFCHCCSRQHQQHPPRLSPSHLASAYMAFPPPFYQGGYVMSHPIIILPQAQRFPLVYPPEGAASFPSGVLSSCYPSHPFLRYILRILRLESHICDLASATH